jgi:small conductance mechanosensitive channel
MYDKLVESFDSFWASIIIKLPEFIISLLVLAVFIIIGNLLYRIFRAKIQARWKDSIIASFLGEFVKWTFYIIGIAFAMFNLGWGGLASSLIAGAGVTAIIIGFAFKDIAENFLAGILLTLSRPFVIGDIIEVNGVKGPAVHVDLRSTRIKTADGRDIFIPNSMVIKNIFTNYTRDGYLRLDFLIGFQKSDDIEKGRELIIAHLKQQPDILQEPSPDVELQSISETMISAKVMFWTDIFNTAKDEQQLLGEPVKSRMMREIKDLLLETNLKLPEQNKKDEQK